MWDVEWVARGSRCKSRAGPGLVPGWFSGLVGVHGVLMGHLRYFTVKYSYL